MTIHAFCRRLLATHPLAAGLDPALPRPRREPGRAAARPRLPRDARRAACRRRRAGRPRRGGVPAVAARADDAGGATRSCAARGWPSHGLPPVGDPVHSPKAGEEPERPAHPARGRGGESARAAFEPLLERFHRRYEALKEERSALDFLDLELRALELLRSSASLATVWRERFEHVMVDEFQDTNRVQLELVEQLRGAAARRSSWSATSTSRSTASATPTSRSFGASAPTRTTAPEPRRAAAARQLPLAPGCARRVNPVGDALLDDFAELTAGRIPADGPGAVELLLTLDEGRATRGAQVGHRGDRPRGCARRLAAEGDRRGALSRRAPARAGRVGRGRARRDRRPAARLHPRRRLRAGAGARRAAPVRGRRPRLLDPAAGRGPDPAARRGREPARRRAPVRRARLVRRRR